MKIWIALAFITSAHQAHAVVPLKPVDVPVTALNQTGGDPFGLQDFLDDLFRPILDTEAWSPRDEDERQRELATSQDPLQYMTANELADELGIPHDYSAQDNAEYMWEKSGAGGALAINVSIAKQTLTMSGTDTPPYASVISTGKKGKGTVRGCFRPTVLSRNHKSRKYGGSPMNFSVFFYGGYALHETPFVRQLGTPASHGCVRQTRQSARYVFETVSWYRATYGNGSIRICVK